jgi:hypothetical protein
MSTAGVLHFRIQGEWITEKCRNLWAEGEATKALNILVDGVHGMTEAIALEILCGRKKLSGWDSKIRLVNDNAKVDDRGIPLPKSVAHLFKKKDRQLQSAMEDHQETVKKVLEQREEENAEAFRDAARPFSRSMRRAAEERKAEEEKPFEPPQPTTAWGMYRSGWLSPDGKFYGCEYTGHRSLVSDLDKGGERALEETGWIKLSVGHWFSPWKFLEANGKITQAQLDTLFDWHQHQEQKMEYWMVGEEGEES